MTKLIPITFYQDYIREEIITKYLICQFFPRKCFLITTVQIWKQISVLSMPRKSVDKQECAQWQTTCLQCPKVWFPTPQKGSTKLLLLFLARDVFVYKHTSHFHGLVHFISHYKQGMPSQGFLTSLFSYRYGSFKENQLGGKTEKQN